MEVEGDHAENAEPEVRNGTVGDEFFDILLDPCDERAVDDADDAEPAEEMDQLREGDGYRR